MTASNNFDAISVFCPSLRQSMNLRKTRYSYRQKRNSSCKDIKSLAEKKKLSRHSKNPKFLSRNLPKTPIKSQKSVLDDILTVKTSDINLVTSTPISHEIRKTISRTLNRCNSNEIAKLNSFKRISCSIISSPIKKASYKIKPSEIRVIPLRSRGNTYSCEKKDLILRNNKRSSNSQLSHFSLNSSVEAMGENVGSTRNSMMLRSQNACKEVSYDIKMSLSRKLRSGRKISKKNLSKFQKTAEVPQDEVQLHNKSIRKSLTPKNIRSVLDKSQILIVKKSFDAEMSQKSRSSLLQSFHETDNSKSCRYSLRNSLSSVTESKSCCKNKSSEKLVSHFPSTPKNSNSAFKKSNRDKTERQKNDINAEKSPQISLTESNSETEISKSSRYSLRFQNQQLSTTASSSGLSSKNSMIYRDITNTQKDMLKSSSNNVKRSRYSLRLSEAQSSKKTTDIHSSLRHSSKKTTSAKKQGLGKNINKNNTSEQYKESTSISKKQKKSANKFQREFLSFTGAITIDDLSLSANCEKRKIKSDGFKLPGKNTLKRKISAIQAVIKADEDYEDDLYDSKKFDKFKDLLMDTSDSETSFAISTPKFPVTPLIRHKTPKFKDCFSPAEYAASRKAAMEYMYRNKKRKSHQKLSKTPVIAEKKKLEYSQVLDNAQKLQENLESLTEEESDNDSYFSFD